MLIGQFLNLGLGKQDSLLGQQRVGNGERLAAVVHALDFVGSHGNRVGVAVLQTGVIELDMAKLLGFQGDVVLQAVHIVAELFLYVPEFLGLHLKCRQGVGRVVLLLHNRVVEFSAVLGTVDGAHVVERLLQLRQGVEGFDILAQALLHIVDDVGTLGMVGTVECVNILVPLVQITDFLVMNLAVDLDAFNTVLHHQTLNHRCHNLFIDLMDAERHTRHAVVLGGPFAGEQAVAHA